MKLVRRKSGVFGVGRSILVLLLFSFPSAAESVNLPDQTLSILGPNIGVAGNIDSASGELNALVLYRYQTLLLGVEGQARSSLNANMFGGGMLVGARFGDHWNVRVLGALGAHGYSEVGKGLFVPDQGVAATLPYVGARLVGGYSFGEKVRFFLGAMVLIDADFMRVTKTSYYLQSGVTREANHAVGETTWGGYLAWGFEFGVGSTD